MKSTIKITSANIAKIQAALDDVNGKAESHVYSANDIVSLAAASENRLLSLVLKKDAVGAVVKATSGDAVAKSYKYSRNATHVVIERRSSGWFLVDVVCDSIYASGGYSTITLTATQDAASVSLHRARYLTVKTAA